MANGLYLPKTARERREAAEAQNQMDQLSATYPDFKDAMELQKAVKLRDHRMSVTWCQQGPNMNRWVILRTDDDGMPHVVQVIKHDDGSYKTPNASAADRMVDTWGSAGSQILREMERGQERRSREAERIEEENHAEVAERIASAVMSRNGIKDRAFIGKGL